MSPATGGWKPHPPRVLAARRAIPARRESVLYWIPVRTGLFKHNKTSRLAALLGIPPTHAAGLVIALWAWAALEAPNGCLGDYDDEDIAIATGWQGDPHGFVAALLGCGAGRRAGFLERDPNSSGLRIHDWQDGSGSVGSYVEKARARVLATQAWRAKKQGVRDVTDNVMDNVITSFSSPLLPSHGGGERGTGGEGHDSVIDNAIHNGAVADGGDEEGRRELWERVLAALRVEMSPRNFAAVLQGTVLLACDGDGVAIGAPTAYQVETLRSRLEPLVSRVLADELGRRPACRFIKMATLEHRDDA